MIHSFFRSEFKLKYDYVTNKFHTFFPSTATFDVICQELESRWDVHWLSFLTGLTMCASEPICLLNDVLLNKGDEWRKRNSLHVHLCFWQWMDYCSLFCMNYGLRRYIVESGHRSWGNWHWIVTLTFNAHT